MKSNWLKGLALGLAGTMLVGTFFLNVPSKNVSDTMDATIVADAATSKKSTAPKYIFLFIGDGMSYPQIQATADYYGKDASGDVETVKQSTNKSDSPYSSSLSFMNFPIVGSAQTYDATSFAPDSASTATSIFTGKKTHSGTINMDITKTKKYTTIAEQLKAQKGFKIGVVTTVNLNHATPAATYAHQPSRKNNYEIGEELVASGFEYFAGGALMEPTGKGNDQTSIYDLAASAGYKVVTTQSGAKALSKKTAKTIVIAETLADSDSMSYSNDRAFSEWALKDYVKKGIEVLTNNTGFFMMVEGGKIDWACHANDAGSTISDTKAFSDAVNEAIKFYKKHPKETLILVTGDHETGGLTIGFAGTNYNTYLDNLDNQQISYAKYNSDYVSKYKENKTSFSAVLTDIQSLFGLVSEKNKTSATNSNLVLTEFEYKKLKTAYDKTMSQDSSERDQEEYLLYGNYEPLTVTITHILNNKSGISFTSYSHTGLPVPVYAKGLGQSNFSGYYDNTDIYKKLAALSQVK
ncbi:MAG: alkaline phosphatase [Velocimicrobium sp.]